MPPASNLQDFAGRVAIVTGAARGLGRAAAARLYERGASVAINVRDRARAEEAARSLGDRALPVPADLAAPGAPEEIVNRTLEQFGRVDIIVNNAALALPTRGPQTDFGSHFSGSTGVSRWCIASACGTSSLPVRTVQISAR